ncbi:MAG: hypothetical protein EOM24_09745 [Chloroflexia bacterium]|nr:hypothetical protein [Chloroflexia bacterium]
MNLSVLAPAVSTLSIPVSCVETGRWSSMSPAFGSKGRAFYTSGRARKAGQVTDSLRARGQRESHQGEIRQDIAAKSARMGSRSETAAMACLYEAFDEFMGQHVQAMGHQPNQVGAVFAIKGAIRRLELFDCAATWRKFLPKLVVSYALDTIESGHSARRALAWTWAISCWRSPQRSPHGIHPSGRVRRASHGVQAVWRGADGTGPGGAFVCVSPTEGR